MPTAAKHFSLVARLASTVQVSSKTTLTPCVTLMRHPPPVKLDLAVMEPLTNLMGWLTTTVFTLLVKAA